MKITISKLKLGIMGREGVRTFTADILLDGKKVADCREDGNGGNLSIYMTDGAFFNSPNFKLMNEWCKAHLPKWGSEFGETEYETDLEMHISNLVGAVELEKQIARDTKNSICFREKGKKGESYQRYKWKKIDIAGILANEKFKTVIPKTILEVQSAGGKILNTNLGEYQHLVK